MALDVKVGLKVTYQLPAPTAQNRNAYVTGVGVITDIKKNAHGVIEAVSFGKLFGQGWVPLRCIVGTA